ncbi:hypothetical protein CFP65_3340 [Kitasatospora sp. MMS16-BH015]|uniref:hypothetical protein n=1 Tax=Kitasatospora sp. MMS16-BH015 TaxID=2018025 RepID=UPI000CA2816A|nr:hypothetical protein [Kitasatospora sp. MMS16-BH015]AUG78138.1 hypothetical protein CFP65_3340 [Kitasatospora sp. MMS16-BH015]
MIGVLLVGVLVLVLGGCGCVVWAARGGPPWTHRVAAATQAAGSLVRWYSREQRRVDRRRRDSVEDG